MIKNKELLPSLIKAIVKNDTLEVSKLLRNGADPNGYEDKDKITPLHYAASYAGKEIFLLLVEAGGDINAITLEELTPAMLAATHKRKELLEIITFLNQPVTTKII